jgi:hypothetical protein
VGVSLFDRKTNDIVFDVNFWHYRAIVEAIRALDVLPAEKVDALHESWQQTGLTADEARHVGAAIRDRPPSRARRRRAAAPRRPPNGRAGRRDLPPRPR